MSKQSEAKEEQGYNPKPLAFICSNCAYYTSDKLPAEWNAKYIIEKNIRCGMGGFAIKKTATCNEFITTF